MSYILEALKKSEQERTRGRDDDLMRFPAAPPPASSLRPGAVLGLSALVLAGGIAIGWWQPWQRSAPETSPQAAAPEKPLVAAPVRAPEAAAVPEAPATSAPAREAAAQPTVPTRAEALKDLRPLLPEGGSVAAPAPVSEKPPAVAAVPAPAQPPPAEAAASSASPTRAAEPKPAPSPASARAAARPAEVAPKAEDRKPAAKPQPARDIPPPPDRVLAVSELPAALREALPPLTVRGFVHSEDAASRMVVVNDRMLHEGDEIAADLRLERIDPDGMVLNFRGYRFVAPR